MRALVAGLVAWAALVGVAGAKYPAPTELASSQRLPDPLVMFDGTRVTTRDQWATVRRPELRALFEHYMYGRYPRAPARVVGRTLFEDREALGGRATLKEVELAIGPPEGMKIYLLIATPHSKTAAPCFLGCNFGGNHLATDDERVRVPTAWRPPKFGGEGDGQQPAPRGMQADAWPLQQIVDRGYAVATFYCGDVQPDRPYVREGLRATLSDDAEEDGGETATIMSWAWGVHRVVDHLSTDASIDPKRLAVMGHSRLGKTALLAGALDERIALVVANQAGCGGSGPSRHSDPKAESVEVINAKFPHWFCENFKAFGDDPSKLPFDQNCLVALCAPRPVLFTAATEDRWANPSGQFAVLAAATPAYELLGVEGLSADEAPAAGEKAFDGRLGYFIRDGAHAVTRKDWGAFLDFADKWLK